MKFGVFDHMDHGGGSLDRQFADRLKLVEAYDRAGFWGYQIAEHHSTPLGCASSPASFLRRSLRERAISVSGRSCSFCRSTTRYG